MDPLKFMSSLVGSLAWPAVVVVGICVFKKPLMQVLVAIKRLRLGDVEFELAAPQDAGKQEIEAIVYNLHRSPHSFQRFRDNTEFSYTDPQFEALIAKHAGLFEKVTVFGPNENVKRPGLRLTAEARQNIDQAIEKAVQKP
jgi:hypothetical protein